MDPIPHGVVGELQAVSGDEQGGSTGCTGSEGTERESEDKVVSLAHIRKRDVGVLFQSIFSIYPRRRNQTCCSH